MSQMKSVRQVSMVLRAVADICLVTDKPKKLKLLYLCQCMSFCALGFDTHPMLNMMNSELMAILLLPNISEKLSRASK